MASRYLRWQARASRVALPPRLDSRAPEPRGCRYVGSPTHHPDEVPASEWGCGFWAMKAWGRLLPPVGSDRVERFLATSGAVGTVSLSGRVAEHEDGYRAQLAHVREVRSRACPVCSQ